MPADTDTDRPLVAVAVLASFVAFLDGSVVNIALPAIGREFGGGLALQQWVVDGYLLTLGALILVAGAVSDQFGRLVVLRMGVIIFAVSSLLCAFAPGGWVLVAARCLQGVGAAFLVPSSLAMINARFSGADQARAIGTWTAWTGTAFVIGPLLGGVLVDAAGWRWIFGLNIVPAVVTLYLSTKVGAAGSAVDRSARVDVVGAVLTAVGLTGAVYALIQGQRLGFSDPAVAVSLVVGVACLVLFPWWEHRAAHPMMPLRIFAARNFAVGNVATVFLYAAVSLGTLIIVLFLQETVKLSATQAGLATLPIPVLSFLLSGRFGGLAGHYGPRAFMAAGPLIAAAGYILMTMTREPFDFWTQMLPGLAVFGLGLSITVSPLTAAILSAVDPAQSGIGSAINNAVSRIAGLIAIAFTGVIMCLGERSDGIGSLGERSDGMGSLGERSDGMRACTVDFAGFHRGAWVAAVLLAVAGLICALGIRNTECDFGRVSAVSTARCRDRAAPPPDFVGR